VARARAAVDLARVLDPPPPSVDVADLLLSLHPMAQLQDDDDAVKITISLIESAEPWTNPGRLGQYQADVAWLEDSSHLNRLEHIKAPCLAMAFEHDCWFPPRAVREAAERIPGCQYTELPAWATAPRCWPPTRSTRSSPNSSPKQTAFWRTGGEP
jgi:pimeloyl-ACP methyl ester carboxylesterase